MSWYRVHNDILENPKLLMLAPSDRWYYLALLSLKSQGILDSFQGNKLDRVVCAKLRLTQAEWEECARRLQEEDLITRGYQPVGWEGRQFTSDNTAERVRKHRAKKKEAASDRSSEAPGSNGDVTLHVTGEGRYRNVSVTPPDTDTDTDKTLSDTAGAVSATVVAKPVDNFQTLGEAYRSPSAEQIIFNRGAALLGQHGITDQAARKFLGMCKQQAGAGRTLDAVVVTLLSQPSGDPKAFMLGVLANQPAEIPRNWEPDSGVVGELEGLGIPIHMIRNARDAFVVWFSDMEIRHSNWPKLFKDWVIRDWERAEFNAQQYRSTLARSAGLTYAKPFQEPA